MNESRFYDIVKEVKSEMGRSIISASINGFAVDIEYKSNSGKQTHGANFYFDKNTAFCTITFVAYATASTHRTFIEKVQTKMRKELDN